MRDTMRTGKPSRAASSRAKVPLYRANTTFTQRTNDQPMVERSPSLPDATFAARAATFRLGTPMPVATPTQRYRPAVQPIRRLPTTMRSASSKYTIPGDRSIQLESLQSSRSGTNSQGYSSQADSGHPILGVQYDEAQVDRPPRSYEPQESTLGKVWRSAKHAWKEYKAVYREGPSEEALALAHARGKYEQRKLRKAESARQAAPRQRQNIHREAPAALTASQTRHYPRPLTKLPTTPQQVRTQPNIARPASTRPARDPSPPTFRFDRSGSTVTQFTDFIEYGRGKTAPQARMPTAPIPAARHDTPQGPLTSKRGYGLSPPPPPPLASHNEPLSPSSDTASRTTSMQSGSYVGGRSLFRTFDGAHHAPSTVGTATTIQPSEADISEWERQLHAAQAAHTAGLNRPGAVSPSLYSRTYTGRTFEGGPRPVSDVPPLPLPIPDALYGRGREPVLPVGSTTTKPAEYELRPDRYVPARQEWNGKGDQKQGQVDRGVTQQQQLRWNGGRDEEQEEEEQRRGTQFYEFYRNSGPVFNLVDEERNTNVNGKK